MNAPKAPLTIVSNRLPVVMKCTKDGWKISPGSGGLVTAMAPVLRNRGGQWIGWPGVDFIGDVDWDRLIESGGAYSGYDLHPVWLGSDEVDGFYRGFANSVLWPMFHDQLAAADFNPDYWYAYQRANEKFAINAARHVEPGGFVWIHDYHLILMASYLRATAPHLRLGFFLHIPFPSLDNFLRLPWREQILRALLDYDLLGFQTPRDWRNFLNCVQALMPDVRVSGRGHLVRLHMADHELRVGAFPISIDYKAFAKQAGTKAVRDRIKELRSDIGKEDLILGVDRLDYSKGLPERLLAFENLLERYPELREKVTLLQVVVPSREGVSKYKDLKDRIERLIGRINGKFAMLSWTPVRYFYRSVSSVDLLALYRMARIGLITPLKDGMNLVAKEYCACQIDRNGSLIISEFAGSAAQLQQWAHLVNPHDIEGIADAIYEAMKEDAATRRWKMTKLRAKVRRQDIFWWVDQFLRAAIERSIEDLPLRDDYIPEIDLTDSPLLSAELIHEA